MISRPKPSPDQIARWTDPIGVESTVKISAVERFKAWREYHRTGDRSKLVRLGILAERNDKSTDGGKDAEGQG